MPGPSKLELAIPVQATDHVLGHPHAAVTLVEYGDFQCPNCKQAAPVVKLLLARFPLGLRLVFRHFPLEVHPNALDAALAAEAAGSQGRFWPMHDMLFEHQAHLGAAQFRNYAERLGLDIVRFQAQMADTVHLQRVRGQSEGGLRSGVRATPTFFVNGRIHDVSFGLAALHRKVEEEVLACNA